MGVSEPMIQASLLGEALENAPMAAFVTDESGRYVAVNRAACAMLGYDREELLTLRITDVARSEGARAEYEEMTHEGSMAGTTALTRKDGSTVQFSYVAGATVVAGMQVFLSIGSASG